MYITHLSTIMWLLLFVRDAIHYIILCIFLLSVIFCDPILTTLYHKFSFLVLRSASLITKFLFRQDLSCAIIVQQYNFQLDWKKNFRAWWILWNWKHITFKDPMGMPTFFLSNFNFYKGFLYSLMVATYWLLQWEDCNSWYPTEFGRTGGRKEARAYWSCFRSRR